MSSSFNIPYQYPPLNYSGVTIQVANPTMNASPFGAASMPQHCCLNHSSNPMAMYPQMPFNMAQNPSLHQPQLNYPMAVPNYQPMGSVQALPQYQPMTSVQTLPQYQPMNPIQVSSQYQPHQISGVQNVPEQASTAYPAQYYLNNYNYVQNPQSQEPVAQKNEPKEELKVLTQNAESPKLQKDDMPEAIKEKAPDVKNLEEATPAEANEVPEKDLAQQSETFDNVTEEQNLTTSKEIINELDARVAEQKEQEKNAKKTKVIALTNEYIMSLENYLNNPNSDIRLMASKEVLTRLDEDRTRFDDAALNALINKMLQDPDKLVRIAALSALSSQLASGNEFTVQLLHQIQQNPNSDKEDVLQVADILLKMSTQTEERIQNLPQEQVAQQPQAEQGV